MQEGFSEFSANHRCVNFAQIRNRSPVYEMSAGSRIWAKIHATCSGGRGRVFSLCLRVSNEAGGSDFLQRGLDPREAFLEG
jgi:hypothetical protein